MANPPDNGPKKEAPVPTAPGTGKPQPKSDLTGVPKIAPVAPTTTKAMPLGASPKPPSGTHAAIPLGANIAPKVAPLGGAPRAVVPGIAPAIAPVVPRVAPAVAAAVESILDPQRLTEADVLGLKAREELLDSFDYFQLLKLPHTATPVEIKKAFYKESRELHPDRFFQLTDPVVKGAINAIYKRVTEAYYVLREDQKRKKYLADVTGPERAAKLRYTESSESELKAEAKRQQEEVFGTNPKARQFYKTALGDIERQSWSIAERNLKSAITFEPSNAKFKEKLAEVQAKLEEQRRSSSEKDSFKIK